MRVRCIASLVRNSFLIAAGAVLMGSVGCASKQVDETSFESISGDLTPEKQGLVERPIDVDAHLAITENANLRMMQEDMGRVWYTDHPSRLSPFPVTSTSGMPR